MAVSLLRSCSTVPPQLCTILRERGLMRNLLTAANVQKGCDRARKIRAKAGKDNMMKFINKEKRPGKTLVFRIRASQRIFHCTEWIQEFFLCFPSLSFFLSPSFFPSFCPLFSPGREGGRSIRETGKERVRREEKEEKNSEEKKTHSAFFRETTTLL